MHRRVVGFVGSVLVVTVALVARAGGDATDSEAVIDTGPEPITGTAAAAIDPIPPPYRTTTERSVRALRHWPA